ncbi:MAG: hypothetical protein RSC91_00665 [Clostridia bacterium]
MKTMRNFLAKLPAALSVALGVGYIAMLCLLVFGERHYAPAYRNTSFLWPNWLLMALGLAVLGLAAWLFLGVRPRKLARPARAGAWGLCALYACIYLVQCVMARSLWFYAGWDLEHVRIYAAALAMGEPVNPAYFQLCPNNAPITALLALPYWLGVKLGLAVPYAVLPYASAAMVNLSGLFTMLCVRRLSQSRAVRWFAFAVSTGWLVLSPYLAVPYTDAFTVLFPVLALYLYNTRLRAPFKWGLIALACSCGGSLKPTVYIVLIALLLLEGCHLLACLPWRRERMTRMALTALAVVIGILPGVLWQTQTTIALAGSAKPEQMLDLPHYLMIGQNNGTLGGFSAEDLAFSQSFATLAERNAASMQVAKERIMARGLWGNLRFYATKAYKAYADGTFAYNGSMLVNELPPRWDGVSVFLRNIFTRKGDANPAYCTLMQGIWLALLALCAYAAILLRKRGVVAVISVTLIGLTMYLLLFEVWPRYLFLYAPFFVILAALGFGELRDRLRGRDATAARAARRVED